MSYGPNNDERAGGVHALLGPTNTGKTHRAIERMLDFDTGMMGLPLRLLAREVYDRVSARVGEESTALVTGEEKRVPKRPRYWICTVEAMPPDVAVDFVAVDEIQLVGHAERGHVFTNRLLDWRGQEESWFLGSETVENLVRELAPGVRVRKLPRLSQLTHEGQSSMRTLARRSAVVAFNLPQVYELADALRGRRGGAAVVLGALSPRVRNAQVALYQAGEVDFLVATDAIGMGLNLDIDHVALASRVKFDGFELRELESAELAQVVGRAGRYLRDGSFGTLAPEPELPPRIVRELEQHRFAKLRYAYYRNAELDFASPFALLRTLEQKPPGATLASAPDADDLLVLRVLLKKPEVLALAGDAQRLRALWEVCRIPNYEKRIPEHQAEQIAPLFAQLATRGRLDDDFIEERVRRLERVDGDIHTLMDRLAAARTWTYVSHQASWTRESDALRARMRELEDRLGDVLHERLLDRFVAKGSAPRRPRERSTGQRAAELLRNQPFAKLAELDIYQPEEREVERRRGAWVEQVVDAGFADFALDARGELWFMGGRIAKLGAGQSLTRPTLKPLLPEWVDAGALRRIERRLVAHTRDVVAKLLSPLHVDACESAPLRGLLYQLEQGLGTALRKQVEPQLAALSPGDRSLLSAADIAVGRFSVFASAMLDSTALNVRLALCRAFAGRDPVLAQRTSEELTFTLSKQLARDTVLRLGFVPLTTVAVRCDVLESLAGVLSSLDPASPERAAEETRLVLGCSDEHARSVLRELPRPRRKRRKRARKTHGASRP